MNPDSDFKGWAKPVPVPPGLANRLTVAPNETLDAMSGHLRPFVLRGGAAVETSAFR